MSFTGTFKDWDRWVNLHRIAIPTLVLGARHDTMDPADIAEMGRIIPSARVGICEHGSHMSMWDDAEAYLGFIRGFVNDVEAGRFRA